MNATLRPHGAGTIDRLPSGRYRFKLTGPDGKRRASPSYATREEAQRVLDAATLELAVSGHAPVGAVTLRGYGSGWLARRSVRSVQDERRLWASHVEASWLGAMVLAEVKRRHVRDFFAELAQKRKLVAKAGGRRGERVESDQTLSRQTCKLVLALVHRVFQEAITDEVVPVNPCAGFRLPREVDPDLEDKWTFLSEQEVDKLLACPDLSEKARSVFEVAIFTGMRQGELWGLRWGDVSLGTDRPECAVRRSYEGPTKASRVRRFPLLPRAAEALRRIRAGSRSTEPEDLVFPNPQGEIHSDGYDAGWATYARARAGIRPEATFHSMRHTCASHLLAGTWGRTWSITEVRDYLGHSSVSVTERYAHLQPGRLHALAAQTCVTVGVTEPGTPDPSATEKVLESPGFLNSRSRVRIAPRSPRGRFDFRAMDRQRLVHWFRSCCPWDGSSAWVSHRGETS